MAGQAHFGLPDSAYTNISKDCFLAEAPDGGWNAEEVWSGKYDDQFEAIEDDFPYLDFTSSTYWVKVPVTNDQNRKSEFYLVVARPLTNKVKLYSKSPDGSIQLLYDTGDDKKFSSRPISHRKFALPILLEANTSAEYLLEVGSDGEIISLPIMTWNPESYSSFSYLENLLLGVYYGLLVLVFIIFSFFTIALRQRIYTFYIAYVLFLLLMQASLDGITFQYLWPNQPWLASHSVLIFSGLSVLFLMQYAASYLQISSMPKGFLRLYKGLRYLVLICLITALSSGITYELTYPIINVVSLLVLLMIIAGIVYKMRKGEDVNLFFILAFVSILAGGILFILSNVNVLPIEFLRGNAIKLGSALEVVFLSLAMAGRYSTIQKEKENAQAEALFRLHELNEVTARQNEMLEKQVKERTQELERKSEQLEEKNKEIIDSITYARRIQEAILPSEEVIDDVLPENFILYLPKDIVAGDFYWVEDVKASEQHGKLAMFAACDCTGHGVPGAMVSVVSYNALNRAVREFALTKPAHILDQVNTIVEEAFDNRVHEVKDGMDVALCTLETTPEGKPVLHYSGANNPLWIVTSNTDKHAALMQTAERILGTVYKNQEQNTEYVLIEIKPDKQPIGKYDHREPFTNHSIELYPGDLVYVFSDGYPDQFGGEKGKKFKYRRLKDLLLSITELPMKEQKNNLIDIFEEWRGDHEQIDDVCIFGIKI